jgi:hypothetical protein
MQQSTHLAGRHWICCCAICCDIALKHIAGVVRTRTYSRVVAEALRIHYEKMRFTRRREQSWQYSPGSKLVSAQELYEMTSGKGEIGFARKVDFTTI